MRNIGPLSRHDDGRPDFLKRLKQSFKDGSPIIDGLSDLLDGEKPRKRITVEYDVEKPDDCVCNPKNIGYFILDGLYDALDALDAKADAIQKRMNLKISKGIGRNTEVCFYDVTNYWFEIGQNDDDVKDESTGETIRDGLRKKGVSKEKRSEPIVRMGLFIDDNGIPVAYRLFPGNRTDQTALRPALKKSIDKMKFGKVIVVADGGLNTGPNIARILKEGNGYIVSKSTKKSDKSVKAWMLEEDGYVWNEKRTFKVKSKIRQRTVKDENGESVKITEKIVCYWSKKHFDREVHENAKFIEYLESVIANPDKLKDKPRKIEKFLAALTMIRLIQHKVLKHRGESALNEDGWKAGVTAERIKKALNGFMADALPGGYYRLTEPNEDMKRILDSLGIDADLRLPTASELRKLKYSFDKATFMCV